MSARLADLAGTLLAWREARGLLELRSRAELLAHQDRRLAALRRTVMPRSPFYAPFAARPFAEWPIVGKRAWMASFDAINTVGVRFAAAAAIAERAERSRDFRPTLRGVTVGLSTGTSGSRGLFLVSAAERRRWAGAMLARLVGAGWRRPLRAALLLRANSGLYETVGAGRIEFRFFDLARPFLEVLRDVERFAPTILVAPAQVLSAAARARREHGLTLAPERVISVAEVLDAIDRGCIEREFGVPVEQIYQATEGFLGATCAQGTLHLNEQYVLFEPEWLDAQRTRFVPVITDLYRAAQPVIRYRLNDVLVPRAEPCPCGAPTLALERIEGREDDTLWLPARLGGDAVPVFADALTRVLVRTVPAVERYEITELGAGHWLLSLAPLPDPVTADRLRAALTGLTADLGASAPRLDVGPAEVRSPLEKQRRVRAAGRVCVPS